MKYFGALVFEKDEIEYQDMPTLRQFWPHLTNLNSGSSVG